jgi:Fe-S-cluster containining protein
MSDGTLTTPLTLDDIARIAKHLRTSIEDFVKNFVVVTPKLIYENAPAAKAHFKTAGPCPFLRQGLCGINSVKPQACRDEVPTSFGEFGEFSEVTCATWHKARIGWLG